MARRGKDVYHKNFGFADKEKGVPMELDAQFRCFSMTKVFAAAVGLMFKEKGLLELEAPVSDYIPSFAREFEVLTDAQDGDAGAESVPYTSFMTGETHDLKYTKAPAEKPVRRLPGPPNTHHTCSAPSFDLLYAWKSRCCSLPRHC